MKLKDACSLEGKLWATAGSHYGRSRLWRGHEENTGQARPSGTPSMTRSRGKNTWQARPSRIRDPPGWPRPLPHPVPSSFFCCSCLPCCGFLCCLLRAFPAPLSLNEDQLKTLINKSPGRWYPMKGPEMKEMLQFKPFCWHSGLFDKYVLSLHKMLMI